MAALQSFRAGSGVIAFPDTNVLMHYQRPEKVAWVQVLGSGPARLVLAMCVDAELDNKKYTGSDVMSRRADLALRAPREHSAALRPGSAATFADGSTVEVFPDEPASEESQPG